MSEDTVDGLRAELNQMKKKYYNLEEHVAEGELWQMDIDDKINIIHKGLCGKIMFITEAMARPDIYEPPLP